MIGEHFAVDRTAYLAPGYEPTRIQTLYVLSSILIWTQFAIDTLLVFGATRFFTAPTPFIIWAIELTTGVLLSTRDKYDLYSDHAAATAFFRVFRSMFFFGHIVLFYCNVRCFVFCNQAEVEKYNGASGSSPLLKNKNQRNEMDDWSRPKDNKYREYVTRQKKLDARDPTAVPLTAAEEKEFEELKKGSARFEALGAAILRSTPSSPASPGAASPSVNLQLASAIDSAFSPTPRPPSPPRHCDTCFCPLPDGVSSAMCPSCPEHAAKLGRPSYVSAPVTPPSGGGDGGDHGRAWYEPPSARIHDASFHSYLSPQMQVWGRLKKCPHPQRNVTVGGVAMMDTKEKVYTRNFFLR